MSRELNLDFEGKGRCHSQIFSSLYASFNIKPLPLSIHLFGQTMERKVQRRVQMEHKVNFPLGHWIVLRDIRCRELASCTTAQRFFLLISEHVRNSSSSRLFTLVSVCS